MTDRRFLARNKYVAFQEVDEVAAGVACVAGTPMRIAQPVVDLCAAPGGARDKQLLMGQGFHVLEVRDGWAFGFDPVDDYVGYVIEKALVSDFSPTHRVVTRNAHIYSRADFKSPETAILSFFSELEISGEEGRFFALKQGGYVPKQQVVPLLWVADDPVEIAEKFLGVPYLWGGNSGTGIDCSGLVQLALWAAGRSCPRDSDLQERCWQDVPYDKPLEKGDLLFWKGHVAMVVDDHRIIHANAYHMAVTYEGIETAIARIADQGDGPVTARKRL